MHNTLTEHLVKIVNQIQYDSLKPKVIEKAKICFLDFLAACFSGAESDTSRIGLSILNSMGKGQITLIGQKEKGRTLYAAFFNGMIAHAEELDDAHRYASGLHLGATIFPAALAVCEARQINGKQFLTAIVSGYEVSSRICRAIDRGHRERGFHSTGTIGPFGACVASAVAMGLQARTIVNALGIAGSSGGGLFAFLEEGATVKHMHTGRASQDGLLSALLAESGMTGPKAVLEAKEGFFNAYANSADSGEVTREIGERYEISNVYHKIHTACGHSFPAIDAALFLRKEILNQISEIKQIEIRTYRNAAILNKTKPQSIPDARFSIPFLVALALVKGRVSRSELVTETLDAPQIKEIAKKVLVIEDTEIEAIFPKFRAARLIVKMTDGKILEKRINAPLGMPDNPLTLEDIEKKFYTASEGILKRSKQEEIVHKILKLEDLDSMTQIALLLGKS